jgi:hypothetical protein
MMLGHTHEVYHILEAPISNENFFLHILILLTGLMLCGALLLAGTQAFSVGWGYYRSDKADPRRLGRWLGSYGGFHQPHKSESLFT